MAEQEGVSCSSSVPTTSGLRKSRPGPSSATDEELTPYADITSYNNFYEFGTDKRDRARRSGSLTPLSWKVEVLGECAKPGAHDYNDIVKPHRLEERIDRLRHAPRRRRRRRRLRGFPG